MNPVLDFSAAATEPNAIAARLALHLRELSAVQGPVVLSFHDAITLVTHLTDTPRPAVSHGILTTPRPGYAPYVTFPTPYGSTITVRRNDRYTVTVQEEQAR